MTPVNTLPQSQRHERGHPTSWHEPFNNGMKIGVSEGMIGIWIGPNGASMLRQPEEGPLDRDRSGRDPGVEATQPAAGPAPTARPTAAVGDAPVPDKQVARWKDDGGAVGPPE